MPVFHSSTVGIEIGDLLRPRASGMGRYVRCLLDTLLASAPPALPGIHAWAPWRRITGWHRKPDGTRTSFFSATPPSQRPWIFHATACIFPSWRSPVEIATVHDLHTVQPGLKLASDEIRRRTAYIQRADRVLCVSHFTRQQVHELLGLPESRTVAIPLAAAPSFSPATTQEKSRLRSRLRLPQEFVLFLGRDRPNKNLHRLVMAYAQTQLDMPLIFAGSHSRQTRQQLQQLAHDCDAKGSLRWLSSPADQDLPALLSCASVLCLPSTFEGFGLPVIEAMACGTPVVTSAGLATEEAAGGHAVLVDPLSAPSIADGLQRALYLSESQREAARISATRRTWLHVAAETRAVYATFE